MAWQDDEIVSPAPSAAAPPIATPALAPAAAAAPLPTPAAPAVAAPPATPVASAPAAPAPTSPAPTPPAAAAAPAAAPASDASAPWEKDAIIGPAPAATPTSDSASTADAAPEQRSALGALGHQVGLFGRAAVQGALALPGMVSDAVTGPVNAGLDAIEGQGNGFRFQKVANAAGNIMDQSGVAKPENAAERVVQDMTTGVASAATGIGAGNVLEQAAGPITKAIGTALAAAPTTQLASAATGAGASGVVREDGGSPLAQTIAGVAGSLAPSVVPYAAAAAPRALLRGGEEGRQAMADNIQAFQDAGAGTPTLGQATERPAFQAAENGLSNVLGGSGIMARKAQSQADTMAQSVQQLSDSLAPNASGADAGEAIAKGVAAFRDSVKSTQERLYGTLDQFIPENTPIPVSNTRAALGELNADIPGAPNLSAWFKNSKLSGLEKSLVADLQASADAQAPAGGSLMNSAAPNPDAATLPYNSIQKLRTLVGKEMADSNFTSEISRSKWAPLYAALSDDLGNAAKAVGPQAEQAWTRANDFTRAASTRMDQISSIVNQQAPEQIFKSATSGLADGGTQIRRLMRSMPVENRREVTAAVLQKLGKATAGQQNELGDAFSSDTFLTNLNKMSPAAKSAIFGSSGFDGLQQKIDSLARVAAIRRDGFKVFANPSGTARMGGMMTWASALGAAIASGNAGGIAAAIAPVVGANLLARTASSSSIVNNLAKSTIMSGAAGPAAAAAVARIPTSAPAPAAPQDNGKGAILDAGNKPFQNRLLAGRVAREQGGHVMQHPNGGFVVLRSPS